MARDHFVISQLTVIVKDVFEPGVFLEQGTKRRVVLFTSINASFYEMSEVKRVIL
jgi:hypothetical protein